MEHEKAIDKQFGILLVIADKETELILMKVEMSRHAAQDEALRSFEIAQGFEDMITYHADNIRAKISLVVTDDLNPKGTELMSYSLIERTDRTRRMAEIKANDQQWRAYKGVPCQGETEPMA